MCQNGACVIPPVSLVFRGVGVVSGWRHGRMEKENNLISRLPPLPRSGAVGVTTALSGETSRRGSQAGTFFPCRSSGSSRGVEESAKTFSSRECKKNSSVERAQSSGSFVFLSEMESPLSREPQNLFSSATPAPSPPQQQQFCLQGRSQKAFSIETPQQQQQQLRRRGRSKAPCLRKRKKKLIHLSRKDRNLP